MSKVLVIELADDADLTAALRAVNAAIGSVIGPVLDNATAYAAIRDDADKVLAVFKQPTEQETR